MVHSITAGVFRNSDDARSGYAAWMWQPLKFGPARFGLVAGLVEGYPKMNDGGWFTAAFLVASTEYRALGVNLAIIPTYADRLHGAVVARFKIRVW